MTQRPAAAGRPLTTSRSAVRKDLKASNSIRFTINMPTKIMGTPWMYPGCPLTITYFGLQADCSCMPRPRVFSSRRRFQFSSKKAFFLRKSTAPAQVITPRKQTVHAYRRGLCVKTSRTIPQKNISKHLKTSRNIPQNTSKHLKTSL